MAEVRRDSWCINLAVAIVMCEGRAPEPGNAFRKNAGQKLGAVRRHGGRRHGETKTILTPEFGESCPTNVADLAVGVAKASADRRNA